ncbi:unnamed protein product [Amoebophrya sp. A25]|nr:unnamed protein product [Amoebophrya sp. A25]|eukprot:GSA25T00012288001.1
MGAPENGSSSCLLAVQQHTKAAIKRLHTFSDAIHERICTSAVTRPILTLLGLSFGTILLLTVAWSTRRSYPGDQDERTKDSVDVWKARENPIIQVEDAYNNAMIDRVKWIKDEERFETDTEFLSRRQGEFPTPHDGGVMRTLFGPAPPQQTKIGGRAQIYYRTKDGSKIFTPQNLHAMCRLEHVWHSVGMFDGPPEGYYLAPGRISRAVQHFAGNQQTGSDRFTFPISDCDAVLTKTQAEIDAWAGTTFYQPYLAGDAGYGFFLEKAFATKGFTSVTRSGFAMLGGAREEQGADGLDLLQEALEVDNGWWNPRFLHTLWLTLPKAPNVEVRAIDPLMKSQASLELVLSRDLGFGLPFTFVTVWLVVFLHTHSFLCASVVVMFVVFAMVAGVIGYYLVLRLAYFDSFLQLTLFVMLAVGADNFFVLWEATKLEVGKARRDATALVAKVTQISALFADRAGEQTPGGSGTLEQTTGVGGKNMVDDVTVSVPADGTTTANGGASNEAVVSTSQVSPHDVSTGSSLISPEKQDNLLSTAIASKIPSKEVEAQHQSITPFSSPEKKDAEQVNYGPELRREIVPISSPRIDDHPDDDDGDRTPDAEISPLDNGAWRVGAERVPARIVKTRSITIAVYLGLSRALKRGASSMFETSFTTAMAFFAMVQSTVSPVAHFGVFAGCMIVGGYILALFGFPQVIALYYLRLQRKGEQEFALLEQDEQSSTSALAAAANNIKNTSKDSEKQAPPVCDHQDLPEKKQGLEVDGANNSVNSSACKRFWARVSVKRFLGEVYQTITKYHIDCGGGASSSKPEEDEQQENENCSKEQSLSTPNKVVSSTNTSSPTSSSSPSTGYRLFPVALLVAAITTGFTCFMLAATLKLSPPSKAFELMPEGHMMVDFYPYGFKTFLSSGGDFRTIMVIWGIDADKPQKNLDELEFWFPWQTNPEPNYYFNGGSKTMTDPEALRHILKVQRRLLAEPCRGREICDGRHPSGKLFLPEAFYDAVHSTLAVNSTAYNGMAFPQTIYNNSGVNVTSVTVPTPGPLAALYYNVPDTVLQSPTFDYTAASVAAHAAPYPFQGTGLFANSTDTTSALTRSKLVAESHYRSMEYTWPEGARGVSKLTPALAHRDKNDQVRWLQTSEAGHPGSAVFNELLFEWKVGPLEYWHNADYQIYTTTLAVPGDANMGSLSFKAADSLYHALKDILDEMNANAPASLGKAVFHANLRSYVLNVELRETLFSGLLLMLPLCFGLLVLASGNIVVSFLAIFNVASLVCQVMGCFQLMGWELGLLESLAGIIVIGLAMDYTLHFCHVFTEAGRKKGLQLRHERVKHAYKCMGPTIFAGFVTSASAGLFLLSFSITPFFQQMGVAIFLTILGSVYMALVYLPCLLLLMGPARDFGDLYFAATALSTAPKSLLERFSPNKVKK